MGASSNHQQILCRGEEKKREGVVYGIVEEEYHVGDKKRVSYGISAYADTEEGLTTVICSVHDVTPDKSRMQELVRKCNRMELSAEHLRDVVEDFIST